MLPTIAGGKIWTHSVVLRQDKFNSYTDFWAFDYHQDFLLLGLPANHMIVGVKVSVLISFLAGSGVTAMLYVGNSENFPVTYWTYGATFVTNVHDCSGIGLLTIPSGTDPTYQYGSSKWFTLSSPGSSDNISQAYCIPKKFSAHDVFARVVMQGDNTAKINTITQGMVEIKIQYVAI